MYYGDLGWAYVLLGIGIWLGVGGGIGALIGASKGRARVGFVLGLIGLIGWIIIAVQPETPEHYARKGHLTPAFAGATRGCPYCGMQMSRAAAVCARCGQTSPPWVFHDGRWWANGYWLNDATGTWFALYPVAAGGPPSPPPVAPSR